MVLDRILIAGGEGTGGNIWAYIEDMRRNHGCDWKVEGFLNDFIYSSDGGPKSIRGLPVLGKLDDAPEFEKEGYRFCFGIHPVGHGKLREEAFSRMRISIESLVTVVHPNAFVAPGVVLEPGVTIAPGCVLMTCCRIGLCSFLSSNVFVGHDSMIGSFCHISGSAVISSYVSVGKGADICLAATVMDAKRVGNYSVVGSCSMLATDAEDESVYVGTPAKFLKSAFAMPDYRLNPSEEANSGSGTLREDP